MFEGQIITSYLNLFFNKKLYIYIYVYMYIFVLNMLYMFSFVLDSAYAAGVLFVCFGGSVSGYKSNFLELCPPWTSIVF